MAYDCRTECVSGTGVRRDDNMTGDLYVRLGVYGVRHQRIHGCLVPFRDSTFLGSALSPTEMNRACFNTSLIPAEPMDIYLFLTAKQLIIFAAQIKSAATRLNQHVFPYVTDTIPSESFAAFFAFDAAVISSVNAKVVQSEASEFVTSSKMEKSLCFRGVERRWLW